jgi:hypothetical protein
MELNSRSKEGWDWYLQTFSASTFADYPLNYRSKGLPKIFTTSSRTTDQTISRFWTFSSDIKDFQTLSHSKTCQSMLAFVSSCANLLNSLTPTFATTFLDSYVSTTGFTPSITPTGSITATSVDTKPPDLTLRENVNGSNATHAANPATRPNTVPNLRGNWTRRHRSAMATNAGGSTEHLGSQIYSSQGCLSNLCLSNFFSSEMSFPNSILFYVILYSLDLSL